MNWNSIWSEFLDWAGAVLPPILKAAVVFALGLLVIRLVMRALGKLLERSKIDLTLHAFIRSLVRISLLVLLSVSCATMSRLVDSGTVVTALGAVGLAVSLAVKDGLSNLAGGMSLLAAKPFSVGDYIDTEGGESGTVEKIDLAHTTLLTPDNKQIYIPNGKLNNSVIINYSSQKLRRLDLEWQIGYEADFDRARELIRSVITEHPDALCDPPPLVRMLRHADSAVVLVSRVWVQGDRYWDLRFDLLEEIKRQFDANGISIPFQQVDVHLCGDAVPGRK